MQLAGGPVVMPMQRRVVAAFVWAWVGVFTTSVAYHLAAPGAAREVLSTFDNGAIFVMVAAGWAPIAPFKLSAPDARTALAGIWLLAALGLGAEAAAMATGWRSGFQGAVYVVYLVQGGLPFLLYPRTIFGRLSRASLGYLFASLASYGVGFAFYQQPDAAWHHVAWHAAVVLGCLLNFGGVRQLLREHGAARLPSTPALALAPALQGGPS